eukprot:8443085-Heterocapsa_arctica.AAC.1
MADSRLAGGDLAQGTTVMAHRPPVTVLVQMQGMIALGLTSAHGPPMNNSNYDVATGTWTIQWKWGTFSYWANSKDSNILFVRYAQLCRNGDLEMVIPIALIRAMGAPHMANPGEDRTNPWWYITIYVQQVANSGVLNDAGKPEVDSYYELLASKTETLRLQQEAAAAAAALGERGPATPLDGDLVAAAALANAELMTDPMHCARMNDAVWKGTTNETNRNNQLS